MTVREPEFTEADRLALMSHVAYERIPRGSHGLPLSEATDKANWGKYRAEVPTLDFAAQALGKAQDAYRKQYPDADMSSLLWRVVKDD